jgi:predicted secreted protein
MALKGKSAVVSVGADGIAWNVVSQLKTVDAPFAADNIDVTVFGMDFKSKIQGLKDATYSLEGFYDPTDTTGQMFIKNAWLADTALYIKIVFGGTLGYSQQAKVTKIDINAAVDGAVTIKIDLDGTGTATIA